MEQMKQLRGRLLGKKCVAVILGLLGLCCPSSLWAEKLDTTFVLDMEIDSTPCYHLKVERGKATQSNHSHTTHSTSDRDRVSMYNFYRINTAYVTNEKGETVDTLFYLCDRITKQWKLMDPWLRQTFNHRSRYYSYHDNGMLYTDSIEGSSFDCNGDDYVYFDGKLQVSPDGFIQSRIFSCEYNTGGTHFTYLDASIECDEYGNETCVKTECNYWHRDEIENPEEKESFCHNNKYDENGNLIAVDHEQHFYDEKNRRIKTISVNKYNDTTYTYYSYGHPIYDGQPMLLFLKICNNTTSELVDDFFPDKLDYELPDTYKDFSFNYIAGDNTIVKESFNDSTNTYTLSASYSWDSSRVTEYHVHFIPTSISSLTINGEPLNSFAVNIHDYWFNTEYNPNMVSYTLFDGFTATESFDDSTNTLTIRLASSNTSETVEYKLHFRPVDGVDDFLGDQVSLYVTDKTICVDGATEPIYVYDLLGTFVGTGRGEEIRIPVRQTGVYVVKAGGKAAKVIVK